MQGKKKIQCKEMDVPLVSRATQKNYVVLSSLGKRQFMSSRSLTVGKLQVFKLAKQAKIVNAIMLFIYSTIRGQQDHLLRLVQSLKA